MRSPSQSEEVSRAASNIPLVEHLVAKESTWSAPKRQHPMPGAHILGFGARENLCHVSGSIVSPSAVMFAHDRSSTHAAIASKSTPAISAALPRLAR